MPQPAVLIAPKKGAFKPLKIKANANENERTTLYRVLQTQPNGWKIDADVWRFSSENVDVNVVGNDCRVTLNSTLRIIATRFPISRTFFPQLQALCILDQGLDPNRFLSTETFTLDIA